ncbi:hypothetical protein BYT27DRAFT_7183660 [Phlegmacium glaucopus]|nr:hypothetical protein BYT27DRAFT_7203212 [Phlegmacium glaucopus]KAF8811725.1 hypothetical protein BYT27DRAFT_7183660 [Phlegmacium glaucopus]
MAMPTFSPGQGPLEKFFSQYSTFAYNPNASATSEFNRMRNWLRRDGDPFAEEAYEAFRDAITKQFNSIYGTDVNNLESWQLLCDKLQVSPIPDNLKECREIVMSTHVNLVDLVDNGVVTQFSSVEELSKYTISNNKYFPKENAYAGELLRHLLRHILHPSQDSGRTRNSTQERGRGNGSGSGNGNGRGRGSRGKRGGRKVSF